MESVTQFVEGFNGTPTSDVITMICFLAIPMVLIVGWSWAAYRQKNSVVHNKKS